MEQSHGHFIERCRDCKTVTRQCRCPGPKEERVGLCVPCSEKEADDISKKIANGAKAIMTGPTEAPMRFSTLIRRLRHAGDADSLATADKIEELKKNVGSYCIRHGNLEDPIFIRAGLGSVGFGCPWCSSTPILKAWEDEGKWTEEQVLVTTRRITSSTPNVSQIPRPEGEYPTEEREYPPKKE